MGFLFAAAYLWFANPKWSWIVAGSTLVAAGLGVRAAASGHIRKNSELTTTGPYAYTRNPLYLGSLLIASGFVLAAGNLWIALAAFIMFLIVYMPVIRAEEEHLRSRFSAYQQYASQVPRFFPRLHAYPTSEAGVYSCELYMKHREYQAAVGAILMLSALIVKMLWVRH
jgi:protein-S-isoprenylcysteine O-methyltransferase Ste14